MSTVPVWSWDRIDTLGEINEEATADLAKAEVEPLLKDFADIMRARRAAAPQPVTLTQGHLNGLRDAITLYSALERAARASANRAIVLRLEALERGSVAEPAPDAVPTRKPRLILKAGAKPRLVMRAA